MSRGNLKRDSLQQGIEREIRMITAQSALFSQVVADTLGLNSLDLECLDLLNWNGNMTAGQLAELSGLTTGGITGLVDRLEKAGYVKRERDPNDRRRVIIQAVKERVQSDILPLYRPLQQSTVELSARYTDEELALILDFLTRCQPPVQAQTARLRQEKEAASREAGADYSAPLGSLKEGRLLFTNGASRLSIATNAEMPDLYRAHFEHPLPSIDVSGPTVTMRYNHFLFSLRRERPAEVVLQAQMPWHIEIRGGASRINADLRAVQLRSFELIGGMSDLLMKLAKPSDTVPIHLSGGAHNIRIERPAGTAARVRVRTGANKLTLDSELFNPVGDTHWESPNYKAARDRYSIEVDGGAKNVTLVPVPLTI